MRFLISLLFILLTACASSPPAPVIDRTPQSTPTPPAIKPPVKGTEADKDWRPDSHIVKKGETLFGIGLEYGIDYREIATANNIAPPYPIQVGQKLDLSSFKKSTAATDSTVNEDDVVITPMKTEPIVVADKPVVVNKPVNEDPVASAVTPVLSEPKAMREPYSLQAMNRTPNQTSATSQTSSTSTLPVRPGEKPAEAKPVESKPTDIIGAASTIGDESITWAWPTQGKVVTSFNEASNKGIDIAGETGQAIIAASAGKVIYSGSDLRGYGKLVIVKHNKTYLSVYAHNSKIVVKEGQNVVAGQKIAEMGNTDSSSTKLHFEIRRLGKSVDPAKYLN
jgi:lipoprotein NlpD